jgi:hypothetical protein
LKYFFGKRIPRTATRAFTQPFWRLKPTALAIKAGFNGGHK